MDHPMTTDEFFAQVMEAAPETRWDVAEAMLHRLDPDERVLVEAWLGDFICALQPLEQVVQAPEGLVLPDDDVPV